MECNGAEVWLEAVESVPWVKAVELLGTAPAAREGSTSIKLESLEDTALEAAWQVAMWQVEDIIEGNKKRMREV